MLLPLIHNCFQALKESNEIISYNSSFYPSFDLKYPVNASYDVIYIISGNYENL